MKPKVKSIISIILAVLCFTSMDVSIKYINGDFALHQVILIRSIIAILFTLFFFIPLDGGFKNLLTQQLYLHLLRGFFLVIANLCFFTALVVMPLGETTSISFIAPLLITVFSVILIGEKVETNSWIALIIGLLGVVIILRPGLGVFNIASMLPLFAALAYAFVQIITRKMGERERASTLAFYIHINFIFFSSIMGLFFGNGNFDEPTKPIINYLFRAWIIPSWDDWIFMVVIGLLSGLGTFFVSQAYRISKAGEVAPFEYFALPISIIWSITFFGDYPDLLSWFGIFLIACSGLYKVSREII